MFSFTAPEFPLSAFPDPLPCVVSTCWLDPLASPQSGGSLFPIICTSSHFFLPLLSFSLVCNTTPISIWRPLRLRMPLQFFFLFTVFYRFPSFFYVYLFSPIHLLHLCSVFTQKPLCSTNLSNFLTLAKKFSTASCRTRTNDATPLLWCLALNGDMQ